MPARDHAARLSTELIMNAANQGLAVPISSRRRPAGPGSSPSSQLAAAAAVPLVHLSNAQLQLDVAPTLGGGITRFDWLGDGAPQPVFRRCMSPCAATDPNQLACYPLLPYSNRIGESRFSFGGRVLDVPRNRASEPLPIHGDGWLASWRVLDAGDTTDAALPTLRLALERRNTRPYAFRAWQTFTLDGATLCVTLEAENAGERPLPFGLGIHPFIPREAGTELSAAAAGIWLSGDDYLPVRHVPTPATWQFGVVYPLPSTLVNHAFTGWGGRATINWPKRRLSMSVEADTDYYILYTPPNEDFFCFEPVDHPINAVNLPGGAASHGMTILAPGERFARRFSFSIERCR
jgi:aldose 1-epimerase